MDKKEDKKPKTFKERIEAIRTTRWIRFGAVALIYTLWVAWMGNWALLLGLVLLFDIYITGYIPFTWWKQSKNKNVRSVMSWIDAIVYALILVYFVFAFLGQNYQIPSSSLEKTLLTGDYLFVNKTVYGPRVPMTPVNFPLVHNELPMGLGKSYLDSPALSYHRLKGLRNVELGDIVVFNFPAGDTIMSKVQNPDYYTLVNTYGREAVLANKDVFGEQIYRPVDRRENYVKRCVGLPGNRFKITDGVVYIDGVAQPQPENVQFNYYFQMNGPLTEKEWKELDVAVDDRHQIPVGPNDLGNVAAMGFVVNEDGKVPPIYMSPLTEEMKKKLQSMPGFMVLAQTLPAEGEGLFPEGLSQHWTLLNYGGEDGILIPAKGMTVELTPENWSLYERPIRVYENNPTAHMGKDGKVYINGNAADSYTFGMDYYFMMGDNRDNSLDSRFWGFVPEDHVVGTPWRVIVSFDKDRSIFNGGIRWNRIFKDANPDKGQ
ncbi:MAG: signal peptidase I [Muribaculaceae bacterium]|jgi:signal peptidase I|nr:signal peptidase I [Muribaculaceae bacterium]